MAPDSPEDIQVPQGCHYHQVLGCVYLVPAGDLANPLGGSRKL